MSNDLIISENELLINIFFRLFEQWVLRSLDWAPHGEWLCTLRGRRLSWPVVSTASQSNHKLLSTPISGYLLNLFHPRKKLIFIYPLQEF